MRDELELDEMQYGNAAYTDEMIRARMKQIKSQTLQAILSEHESKIAAIHEPDAIDRTIAGLSFVAACVICVLVVLYG